MPEVKTKDKRQKKSVPRPDVSVVVNVHNEANFLGRTFASIEEAAIFASHNGLNLELIIVLDSPNEQTTAWVEAYKGNGVFSRVERIKIRKRSLGLARKAGISEARGTYICLGDADDLISYNYFWASYSVAISCPKNALVFPEYIYAFGSQRHIAYFRPGQDVSRLAYFSHHPYLSRIFTHRDTFESLDYMDSSPRTGFSFEDWHFNLEALAQGFYFEIARATVLFYRQRQGSILANLRSEQSVSIPHLSSFHHPKDFLSLCAKDYHVHMASGAKNLRNVISLNGWGNHPALVEAIIGANKHDSAIHTVGLEWLPIIDNADYECETGAAYYRACQSIQDAEFTDVILLPFLIRGGGEKYILDVVQGLSELENGRRCLILCGQRSPDAVWQSALPEGAVFIDLYTHALACDNIPLSIDLITFRIIQTAARRATIHMKSCDYVFRFIGRFHDRLPFNRLAFYRFSDPVISVNGTQISEGYNFNFLSDFGDQIDLLLSDNKGVLEYDAERLDHLEGKQKLLPALCEFQDMPMRPVAAKKRRVQLLWASRIAKEKRPDMLVQIAKRLEQLDASIDIHVCGDGDLMETEPALFENVSLIRYHGHYDKFEDLLRYSASIFIYTSAYDGMPNVVLEAALSKMVIIAPDVGGVGEFIEDEVTGLLMDSALSFDDLVEQYVAGIVRLIDDEELRNRLATKGYERVRARHSRAVFLENLSTVFDVDHEAQVGTA